MYVKKVQEFSKKVKADIEKVLSQSQTRCFAPQGRKRCRVNFWERLKMPSTSPG